MIAIIPIDPISDAHGVLIVEVFNRFFIDRGGQPDGGGVGNGGGYGYGNRRGDGYGLGWDHGFGNGNGDGGGKCPEAWQAE